MSLAAQQEAQYSQYMYNTIAINPAYAGTREAMTALVLHRSQWLGLPGSPKTNMFSLHTPLPRTNLGIGVGFINDEIGPTVENQFAIDFSYGLKLTQTAQLNFGLKTSFFNRKFNSELLDIFDPTDPIFQSNLVYSFQPNFGLGAYYFTDVYYLGISSPNIINTPNHVNENTVLGEEFRHLYLMGGYVFNLNKVLKIKPTFLVKAVGGSPLQTDLSANFLYNELITFGFAYRWNATLSAMAGFQLTKTLFLGYAYDADVTPLFAHNKGSHEFFLRYDFVFNLKHINNPRFF